MRGGIELEGEIEGFGALQLITSDIREALREAEVIMVVIPASAHREVSEICAPHPRDGQIVVLNPGRTLGALEFLAGIREYGCTADIIVGEAQTLLYASRATGPGQVRVFRLKNSIPLSTIRAHKIPDALNVIRKAFPQFVPGDDVFKTSFDNVGSVFHPAIAILNTGWIEDLSDFQFYIQGCTRSVATVLERLDAERVALAAAPGIKATSARDWLYLAYDAAGKSLYHAMHANPGYRGIMAPTTMEMRYLSEDIPYSLAPMSSLGDMPGVPTPTMKAFIYPASVINGVDYMEQGRTVEKPGIKGMSVKELRLRAIGEK